MDAWDNWYKRKEGVLEPEIPKLTELMENKKLTRVFDLGCGNGRHAAFLAEKGLEVHGIDVSERAVSKANSMLWKRKLTARLLVGNMRSRLPYPDEFFGAVIATRVIHHSYIRDIIRTVGEIDRVLARSGYVFIQSPAWLPESKVKDWQKEVEPRTLVWSEGDEAGVPHHHFTKEELLDLFENYHPTDLHVASDHYGGWCFVAEKVRVRMR